MAAPQASSQPLTGGTLVLGTIVLSLATVATPFVGANIARLDARKVVTASFLVFALVMWMRSQFSTDTTPQAILIPLVVQGLALAAGRLPVQHIDANVRTLKKPR